MSNSCEIQINSIPSEIWRLLVDVNGYAIWNPHIKHAVIFGSFEEDAEIKLLSGRLDYKFTIVKITPESQVELTGGTTGITIDIHLGLEKQESTAKVTVDIKSRGWLASIRRKKIENIAIDFIDLFLSSLKVRSEKGESAAIKDEETSEDNSRSTSFHMPTPFNIVYKSGTRSKRRKMN